MPPNTSPCQCQLSIPPQVPSIFPPVQGFLQIYTIFQQSPHTTLICFVPSCISTLLTLHLLSLQVPAEAQYELSISKGVTPASTTKASPKPKCVPCSHHFTASG